MYKGPADVDPVLPSGAHFPVHDPLYFVLTLASVTEKLVLGPRASTTYDAPYRHARRFSTVDHLAEGRVAWNIVTSYLDSAQEMKKKGATAREAFFGQTWLLDDHPGRKYRWDATGA